MSTKPNLESLLERTTWLRGLAGSLVSDSSQADDLLQETWLAAIEKPPRDPDRSGSWLARVLRNFAHLRRRSEKNRSRREAAAARPERTECSPSEVLERAELHQRVAQHVLELPEPFRTTVLLRFYEGMSPREIALEQEVPVTTIRSRLSAGLERLRARLDREHRGGREAWRLALLPIAGMVAGGGTTSLARASTLAPAAASGQGSTALILTAGGAMTFKTTMIAGVAGAVLLAGGLGLGARFSRKEAADAALEQRHGQALARIGQLEREVAAGRRRLDEALRAASKTAAGPATDATVSGPSPVLTSSGAEADGGAELRDLLENADSQQVEHLSPAEIESTLARHGRRADYLVSAALLTDDPGLARAYLLEALEKDPRSPDALLALLNLQTRQGDPAEDVASTIARLAEADPSNAFPQLFSAAQKLGKGDFDGCLADLREAALRPRLNDYDAKHFPLQSEFYGDAGHAPAAAKLLALMGTRVEELLILRDLSVQACDHAAALLSAGDAARAAVFAEAAENLGAKLSSTGRTLLSEAMGMVMETKALEREKAIWEAQGDTSRMEQLEKRLESVRERGKRYKIMAGSCIPALRELSEDEVSRYFDRLLSEGEAAATSDLPGVRDALREAGM